MSIAPPLTHTTIYYSAGPMMRLALAQGKTVGSLSVSEFTACMQRMFDKAPTLKGTLILPLSLPSPLLSSLRVWNNSVPTNRPAIWHYCLYCLDVLQRGRLAVAFSGGPDSMALLGLLQRGYGAERILALFVHHNLQPKGVTEDEALVRGTCERLGTILGDSTNPF